MPSTRRHNEELMDAEALPSDWTSDEGDPDYREDSADSDDEVPQSMGRDRAEWVVANQEAIEELYKCFKEVGEQLFGTAFFQCGSVTPFAHFVYKQTMPH